jgi:hypothetical protein
MERRSGGGNHGMATFNRGISERIPDPKRA